MNPFRNTVMSDPWETPGGDVPSIHEAEFLECLRGLQSVRASERSTALLIHGEAGSGKTHLLSRLRATLAPTQPAASDRAEALFVWVRLQTSPRMIWRTVRRTLVNDWFRRLPDGRSQFDRILYHRLAEIRVAEGDLEPWHEYMLDEHPQGLSELVGEISGNLQLDRNTHVVLEHLVFGRHRRDLQAWLCGDSLPEAALNRLELEEADEGDEEREDQARRTILMLCRLAGQSLPVVIALDQVEALETGPEDRAALFAFGQLVSTLHDATSNVLLIAAVQSAYADRLQREARAADHDRMTSAGRISLSPLTGDQARQLIAGRLQATGQLVPADCVQQAFWPLQDIDVVQLFKNGGVTPRMLLNRCADRFDSPMAAAEAVSELGDAAAAAGGGSRRAVSEFLEEVWGTVVEETVRGSRAERSEEILRHALPMVARMLEPDLEVTADTGLADVPAMFRGSSGRVGVSICIHSNMTRLAAQLRRLRDQAGSGRLDRLVVIRDARVPVTRTARRAQQYLRELQEDGRTKVVHPSVEVLAALDALRALLSDARSGDLSCAGETVSPGVFEEWFRGQMSGQVQEFVREVLEPLSAGDETSQETALFESLQALLAEQPVLRLQVAAEQLGVSPQQLIALSQRFSHVVGVLGDGDRLVFRAVAADDDDSVAVP
ncbi:MAG: AAA family ATPase [Planctomyces sp.]